MGYTGFTCACVEDTWLFRICLAVMIWFGGSVDYLSVWIRASNHLVDTLFVTFDIEENRTIALLVGI